MIVEEKNIRDILAVNIKEKRRMCGFSQKELAEKAGISTPFLAMIEVSRKFPSPSVLTRLARAMNVKTYQLFAAPFVPGDSIEQLQQSFVQNINKVIEDAVERAVIKMLLQEDKEKSSESRASYKRSGKKLGMRNGERIRNGEKIRN